MHAFGARAVRSYDLLTMQIADGAALRIAAGAAGAGDSPLPAAGEV